MSRFFKSSIGKKILMSITGLFLITFICVHLSANLMLFVGKEMFNTVVEFMRVNPVVRIMEPILASGFVVHISYSVMLTIQNRKARGTVRYEVVDQQLSSTWASRNMFILGALILVFLVLHLLHFFVPMKFTGIENTELSIHSGDITPYDLIVWHFEQWYYVVLYILGGILLGLHLSHGFWSAFQTLGWSNMLWRKRLTIIGNIFAIMIAAGFSIIPLYFFIKKMV